MTALEARQMALDKQKNRWAKLSPNVRGAIQDAIAIGELHCIATLSEDMDVLLLRKLGYNVRDIVDDVIEISW